jgi:hypothetical protein
MKIIMVASGVFFLWFFFHRRRSLLGLFTFHIASTFASSIVEVVRALLFGYIAYALVAVYGSIGSISTFADVITILSARPSQVGGAGIVGVIFGVLIGAVTFFSPVSVAYSESNARQGRHLVHETGWRRSSILVRSVRSVAVTLLKRKNRS